MSLETEKSKTSKLSSSKSNKKINEKEKIESEYKCCTLIWNTKEYGLTILTMENAKGFERYNKPIFYIPLRTFMRCGAFWSALTLSTIFWEQRPYNIERTFKETEKIKGAYLIAFAPNMSLTSTKWAEECVNTLYDWPRNPDTDNVFIQIIIFQDAFKDKIINAIKSNMLKFTETENNQVFCVHDV